MADLGMGSFKRWILCISASLLTVFYGCTGTRIHKVSFLPSLVDTEIAYTGITVSISPFEGCPPPPLILGRRVRMDGKEEKIVLESADPCRDLTHLLWDYLQGRGYRVRLLPRRPEAPEELTNSTDRKAPLVISPKLELVEINAKSSLVSTELRYRIRISAKMAIWGQNEIIERAVELNPRKTTALFKIQEIERVFDQQLKVAFEHLLQGLLPEPSLSSDG
jgi:hypothetical protein